MRISLISILSILTFALCSCTGYQLGNSKPTKLGHIKTLTIPLVQNDTQEVKLAAQATNALVATVSQDGSYKVVRKHEADATLHATIKKVEFTEFRSNRLDTLRAEELNMVIHMEWQLVDNAGKVLDSGKAAGATRFFTDANQRLSRDNAYPAAIQKAAQNITSRIANGF